MRNKREAGKPIIIYTAGSFDLFHSGHLNVLKKAKELGDYLIVAVSTNALIKSYKDIDPIMNYAQRVQIIKSIKYVDRVVKQTKIFDVRQFNKLGANYFVIGDDWKKIKNVKGLNWLKKHKKVIFIPYTKSLSSSKIKEKIIKNSYQIIKSHLK